MDKEIRIGAINNLKIMRFKEPGAFLSAENGDEVLLPNRYVEKHMKEGDEVDVFVYTDSEDRPVAATERPLAMAGEFGFFEVVSVAEFGAFVDWGLPKDLLVPKRFQKTPFRVGDSRILRVIIDGETNRVVGDESVTKYLKKAENELKKFDRVGILVLAKTPMGYKCIVNDSYEGMIYENEIFEKVYVGDLKTAYVKNVRPDGKLDLSLFAIGEQKKDEAQEKLLALLKRKGGKIPLNYKSDAEEIQGLTKMSKKSFKAALTALLAENTIAVDENGVTLLGR